MLACNLVNPINFPVMRWPLLTSVRVQATVFLWIEVRGVVLIEA